ncbi:cytochrome b/b6 domain-containing protein [Lichenihabitans sp. PAMC28606]|uniref:cytochrome b/b6 domain-containing protein n=1 Tax=Lichenihabitans sp. PAMC28606 TaxID=2880932 RepID=UPI001D0AF0B0|nr:cytochrome b/b6 domain-containing protein [Lichenihabitans sp. PAMC28606]UDL93098.1 cytochrome b/b6 domain-containing protein [Lichenihabitans sp. PAMC28606]
MRLANRDGTKRLHPWPVRVMHWLNAIAVIMMVGSGWRIYDNDPIFSQINFPVPVTLGGLPSLAYHLHGDGGFSNALLWHFTFMWLLVLNGVGYVAYGLITGRFRRMWWPIRPREVVAAVIDALHFKLDHEDVTTYNAVQKAMYVGVLTALIVIVAAGAAIWKPVQLHWLVALFGGFQGARLVHFLAMVAIVAFMAIHVLLALLVPRTIKAMVFGGPRVPASQPTSHLMAGE